MVNLKRLAVFLVISALLLISGCSSKDLSGIDNPLKDTGGNNKVTGQRDYVKEINLLDKGLKLDTLEYSASGSIQISPDGRYAVFCGTHFGKNVQEEPETILVLVNLFTGSVKELDSGTLIKVLDWSPDGTKVLYKKFESLLAVEINNSRETEISSKAYYGAFSPDGSLIAYVEQGKGIYISKPDGSEKRQVTSAKGDWFPVWYPDGKNLFYFADLGKTLSDGAGQLEGFARVNIDTGENETLLSKESGKYRRAEWLIPGQSLVINKGWDDGSRNIIVNLATGKITDLGEDFNMQYSFAQDQVNGLVYKAEKGEVSVIDENGTLVRKFSIDLPPEEPYTGNFDLAVSPNGKFIAYLSGVQGYYADSRIKGCKLKLIDSGGKNEICLTPDYGHYHQPVWTPDGKHIVTIETGEKTGQKFHLKIFSVPVQQ